VPRKRTQAARVELPTAALLLRVEELIESSRQHREAAKDLHEATKALHRLVNDNAARTAKRIQ
jgi:hypothetical protein